MIIYISGKEYRRTAATLFVQQGMQTNCFDELLLLCKAVVGQTASSTNGKHVISLGTAGSAKAGSIVDCASPTCISVVFFTSISAGDSCSVAAALSAAKANACWHDATAGEKAISKAAAVLTAAFLKLSALGNGDAPIDKGEHDDSREAPALLVLILLLLLSQTGVM